MENWLLWLKALHVMSVIAWMAGLFYLPRLYVYHVDAGPDSDKSNTFKIMERRLLKGIMNPAAIAVWTTGSIIAYGFHDLRAHWLHVKILLVLAMTVYHVYLASLVGTFAREANTRSAKFYRFLNEVPTVLMALIVFLVVVQPF